VKEGKSAAVGGLDFGERRRARRPFHKGKETTVNVSPSIATVNADSPTWKEANQPNMREAAATALSDIEIMLDWADEAVAAAGADPKAKNEIDAIFSALNAIRGLFAGARGSFETIPVIAN
jgi:hypothetical protein